MKSEMGASHMIEWRKFFELEPWGFQVEWLKSAMIAATVASSAPRKKGSRAPKIADFMPKDQGQRQAKSPEELKQKFLYFTAMAAPSDNSSGSSG